MSPKRKISWNVSHYCRIHVWLPLVSRGLAEHFCMSLFRPFHQKRSYLFLRVFWALLFVALFRFSIEMEYWVRIAEGEIKGSSLKTIELSKTAFKAWNRSEYSHACFAKNGAKNFFFCNFCPPGPFSFIFLNISPLLIPLDVAFTSSCVGLLNKIGHRACRHKRLT